VDHEQLRVNGNVGTVQYVNGEISLLGRGGIQNTALTTTVMDNADYRNYTPYVVGTQGPTLTGDDPSEFATIQAAINQAVADGATNAAKRFVFIKPGTYVEDLSLTPAVTLYTDGFLNVNIVGAHSITLSPTQTFIAEKLTFIQRAGAPAFTINATGTNPPPNINRITLSFFQCVITQVDSTTTGMLVNVPGQSDVCTLALINTQIRGTRQTGAGAFLLSTGNGSIDFNSITSGFNDVWINITSAGSPGAGGTFLFSGNNLKIASTNISSSIFTCTSALTTASIRACFVNNDNSPTVIGSGFLNVVAGVWQLVGNIIQNPKTMVCNGVQTELWAVANTIYDNTGLPLFIINNNASLFAQGNILQHTATDWVDSLILPGFYVQQPALSNTFRALSSTTPGATTVVAAVTF